MDLVANRSRLSGQEFRDEQIGPLDLRNAIARASRWIDCTFDATRLSLTHFSGAYFEGCVFRGCDLQQAHLEARFHRCRFERCKMDQADFTGAWFTECSFTRSRAQLSVWNTASLYDTRVDLDLRHAKFDVAICVRVDFRGSNLWAATVPLNCTMVSGNRFDTRQIGAFLALLQQAIMPTEMAEWVAAATPEASRRLVHRILGKSRMEPAQP